MLRADAAASAEDEGADAVEEEVGVRREAVEALLDVAAAEDAVRLFSP